MVHVVKPDPAKAAGSSEKFGDALKSSHTILLRGNERVEVGHQLVALREHVVHYKYIAQIQKNPSGADSAALLYSSENSNGKGRNSRPTIRG